MKLVIYRGAERFLSFLFLPHLAKDIEFVIILMIWLSKSNCFGIYPPKKLLLNLKNNLNLSLLLFQLKFKKISISTNMVHILENFLWAKVSAICILTYAHKIKMQLIMFEARPKRSENLNLLMKTDLTSTASK